MKKLVILGLFLGMVGSTYALEKLDITVGGYLESENHNAEYSSSDLDVTGVRVKLALKDIPLWTEFAYEYRNANLSGHTGDEDRYKFMIGYKFEAGSFVFRPEYELRVRELRESPDEQWGNRFKPNWDYKFNDQWTLFNNWMFTYQPTKADRGTADAKNWDDYYHEIETGVKYKFEGNQAVLFSIYNEYEKDEKSPAYVQAYSYDEWQVRLAYEKKFDNGVFVSPFVRIGIDKSEETTLGYDNDHKLRNRYGAKMGYVADNGIGVYGEAYYQDEEMQNAAGVKMGDRDKMFFKLGLDYKF